MFIIPALSSAVEFEGGVRITWILSISPECVTNGKNESSFQCCIKDEGRPLIYALREEYINHFMVL
jgi:hypothetical protein